jgi:hypothetical protein
MTCLDRISLLRALEQKWLKNDTRLKLCLFSRATADSSISELQFTTVLGGSVGSDHRADRPHWSPRAYDFIVKPVASEMRICLAVPRLQGRRV